MPMRTPGIYRPYRRYYRRRGRRYRRRYRSGSRWRRRYLPRIRRNIGVQPGKLNACTRLFLREVGTGSSSYLLNTGDDLLEIPRQGTGSDPSDRLTNRIFVTGFKIFLHCNLLSPKDPVAPNIDWRIPYTFHFALVSPKRGSLVTGDDFFKSHGDNEGQSATTARPGITWNTAAINSDEYDVLVHKKFKMFDQAADHVNVQFGNQQFQTSFWVPLRRQIPYDNELATSNKANVFIVHWIARTSESAATTIANVYDARWRAITYFRNIIG